MTEIHSNAITIPSELWSNESMVMLSKSTMEACYSEHMLLSCVHYLEVLKVRHWYSIGGANVNFSKFFDFAENWHPGVILGVEFTFDTHFYLWPLYSAPRPLHSAISVQNLEVENRY